MLLDDLDVVEPLKLEVEEVEAELIEELDVEELDFDELDDLDVVLSD